MSSLISQELRQFVAQRAYRVCEYCLIHEDDTFHGCQVDHIISIKHGGPTSAANLAHACAVCNRAKGSDIASLDPETGELCRLFNPRSDRWLDHFQLIGSEIEALTAIGRVTARVLAFNSAERILERVALIEVGRYPTPQAGRILRR